MISIRMIELVMGFIIFVNLVSIKDEKDTIKIKDRVKNNLTRYHGDIF